MTPEFGTPRTAIVTGGARRIGAELSRALSADGWHVLIHCSTSVAQARALAAELGNARVVAADLSREDCAERIFSALEGMPPPALLVNNASRFAFDSLDDFNLDGWAAHLDVNARAPLLLTRAFAQALSAGQGQGGLVVNMLDAKLAFPNPDFLTYTLSKMMLAGITELTGRALAGRGIRVCGIAPSVTLASGPQTRENFDAVHRLNALGRGVTMDDVVAALRYVIAAPTLTGQTIFLDGGQRFLGLGRDVQFLDG